MMCEPRQRGGYYSQKCSYNLDTPRNPVIDYCAHCLNGGTVSTVRTHLPSVGWEVYNPTEQSRTARRAGLCGDPLGRIDHMIGGDFMPYQNVPIVEVYKQGAEVDFLIEVDTNHNGYFEFFLCDLEACSKTDIDISCFEQGHCHRLERVEKDICQTKRSDTTYECGPVDPAYPGRFYLPCRNTGHVGIHLMGGESGTMRYKLPEGLTCKHCVLQWYWATGNSCNPRGVPNYHRVFNNPFGTSCQSDGGGTGAFVSHLSRCGEDRVPEEFWSCADVQVTVDGAPAGAVRAQGIARADPNTFPDDGDRAKHDPDGMIDEGKKEMEDDIQDEADRKKKQELKDKRDAKNGKCELHDEACDGTIPCCDVTQVCVYTMQSGGFSCRFWWGLWEEVHDQEKLARK